MQENAKPVANSRLVLREEFDDWAILFDPDTGTGYGMNPVSAFIWKLLDGSRTEEDIFSEVKNAFENVPDAAPEHISKYLEQLKHKGFIGFEIGNPDVRG